MENLAAVLYAKHDLRLENCPPKDPEQTEVQIAVKCCGICGTDAHLYETGIIGAISLTSPIVIGHEFSGVVTKVGSDVTNVKAGDRVTVDVPDACGSCRVCRLGLTNVCCNLKMIGITSTRGGMARVTNMPARQVFKFPDSVEFEEAAMIEPVSVCVNAVQRAKVKAGDSIVVFGAGPIGLLMLQVALANGADVVCVTDIIEERLKLARELGATHTVLFPAKDTDYRVMAAKIVEVIGEEADAALECSGAPVCLQSSIYSVRPGGTVAAVGIGPDEVTVPMTDLILREIEIRGCVSDRYDFPTAIKLVTSKKVNVKPLISHRFHLKDLFSALDLLKSGQAMKIMINCEDENGGHR